MNCLRKRIGVFVLTILGLLITTNEINAQLPPPSKQMQAMQNLTDASMSLVYNSIWRGNSYNNATIAVNNLKTTKSLYDSYVKLLNDRGGATQDEQNLLDDCLVEISLGNIDLLKALSTYPDPGLGKADYYISRQQQWYDLAKSWYDGSPIDYDESIYCSGQSLYYGTKAAEQLNIVDGLVDSANTHNTAANIALSKISI